MKTLLDSSFYARDTATVARDLLGKRLVSVTSKGSVYGIIIETEAYGFKDDPASHAYCGKTARNVPMFGPVGHAYIYTSYGIHYCFNVVAREPGVGAGAVLIRAVTPLEGVDIMRITRGEVPYQKLTNGPGKVTQAFAITPQNNTISCMEKKSLYITDYKEANANFIVCTPRIGISKATDILWRFVYQGS